MEPKFDDTLNKENLFPKFGYLELILKSHNQPYNNKSMTMEQYLICLHRIVFGAQGNSNEEYVQKTENFFKIMIRNSIRLEQDSILFRTLSYFIRKGFDLFISVLKSDKVTSKKELNQLLLEVLDTAKIEDDFNINKGEIEKAMNIAEFKKAMSNVKFKNKIMCFVLLFFRKFIQENDKIILGDLKDILTENNISNFYEKYDKEITKKNKQEDAKISEEIDKNEIKDDLLENKDMEQKNEISPNKEKEMTETGLSEDSNKVNANLAQELLNNNSNDKDNNPLNNKNIRDIVGKLTKEIEDLKAYKLASNKEIEELKTKVGNIGSLQESVKALEKKTELLDKKLSLSLLINNLNAQRDSYKKSLEVILKHVIKDYNLTIEKKDEPLWKRTKEICKKLFESQEINKSKFESLENVFTCLLFCKDYSNCLVHGKGKFSETINKYYSEHKEKTPFIAVASYKNMKDVTEEFFGSTVNELEEFKFINLLLLDKINEWHDANDYDYSKYLTEDGLDCKEILSDFEKAVNIMDQLELSNEIDSALEN